MATNSHSRDDMANSLLTGDILRPRPHVTLSSQGEQNLELPGLHVINRHKPLKTISAIIASLTLQVLLLAAVFLLPWYYKRYSLEDVIAVESLLAYIHCVVWLFTLLIHFYLRKEHNLSRRYGYGTFYRQTVCLRRIPFYTVSLGTVTLLLLVIILRDLPVCHKDDKCSLVRWIQFTVGLEFLLCFATNIYYLVRIVRFNFHRATPDVFQESSVSADTAAIRVVLGYRDKSLVEELLEKQFEKIVELTERCHVLSRQLLATHEIHTNNASNIDLTASLITDN